MMLKNLISMSNKFYEDQAIIFLTFGGFGRYVLYLLHEEFKRLRIPADKVNFLAFDTEQPHRDRINLERESEYLTHLSHFDGDIYIENEENKDLKKAVNHIPVNLLCDIEAGCKGVPAVGFVAFHKYDDLVITKQALRLIDDVRAKNPGKKIKLIIVSGMGGSVSNGMTIPFLYRIRNRLREKKIRVEVFLATSEGYLGLQNVQEDGVERNCVASAMLWEYAMAGRNGLIYPGKKGVRDRRMFDGRIAHRVYIFSGGSAETSLKYQAIASTMAMSISSLELTKVGSYLDGDRVNYSAHILEREWHGEDVFIKLYIGAEKLFRKELEGLRALHAGGIAAPAVRYSGSAGEGTIYIILLEPVQPATTLEAAWEAAADEQARIELLFELANLKSHRRLRHMQLLCRLGEIQQACYRVKDF